MLAECYADVAVLVFGAQGAGGIEIAARSIDIAVVAAGVDTVVVLASETLEFA